MSTLITLVEFKEFLHTTEVMDDTMLQGVIDGEIAGLEQLCGKIESSNRLLTFAALGYVPCVAGDIGLPVIGAVTTDSGILISYNNTTREWVVSMDASGDMFDVAEAISITAGTGAGTTTGASVVNDIIEYHDGDRTNMVILDNGLVNSITSLNLDDNGDGVCDYALIEHDDYEFYPQGIITKRSGYFPSGLRNIEIKYKQGYTNATLPQDLRLALLKMMSNTYHQSIVAMEVEGSPKIYTATEINNVIGKYVRLTI